MGTTRLMAGGGRIGVLRGVVYGAIVLFTSGLGCKGCSCANLPKKLLVSDRPTPRVPSDVEMLDEGAEPRVTLRVARWTGLRYRQVIEASGSTAFEGQPAVPGPTVTMTVDSEVLRGTADPLVVNVDGGVERLVEERVVVDSLRVHHDAVPKPVLDAWNQALVPFRGTSYRHRITESGGIPWFESELFGGVVPAPEVRKAMDAAIEAQRHFPFRLPPGSVGVGARWRFREQLLLNGTQVVQVAEMRLKGVDGNFASIGLALRQEAPRQEVPHPLVPGQKAVLEVFRGDGQGDIVVDRLTAIVVRARVVGTARLTLSGEVGGQHGTATLLGASTIVSSASVLPESDAGRAAEPGSPDPAASDNPRP